MKKYNLLLIFLLLSAFSFAQQQQPKKPVKPQEKPPTQSEMDKMMEEAMQGMSPEEKAEMKKMMKQVMPALTEQNKTTADYPEFKSNKLLIPKKDQTKIAGISKKLMLKSEMLTYTTSLYNKLLVKGNPEEITLVKKILTQSSKANDIGSAAFLCLLQGHPQAAMALYLKTVLLQPDNPTWQNNSASLLTQFGFAELSFPFLIKLKNEQSNNSTVLNNMGYAWLNLGQTDSARQYFEKTLKLNPKHPEASAGKGLIDEESGNNQSASRNYKKSLENVINPFTNQLLQNNNGGEEIKHFDLDQLKNIIPYYEYFGEDWINTLPEISNNVYSYSQDKGTQTAYKKMADGIINRVKTITDKLDDDLDQTSNKGEDEFVRIMTEETMKGLNMMSKPAVIIKSILHNYMNRWQDIYQKEMKELEKWKEIQLKNRDAELAEIFKKINNSKNGNCRQYKIELDSVENKYMRTINSKIKTFLVRKTDELRHWANMYVSWNWYVAGNFKNVILLQDYGFLSLITETCAGVILSLEIRPEHCINRFDEITKTVISPQLPNFDCRPILSVPAGPEWEELVTTLQNFNDNKYGIKKTDEPIPNVSASYGINELLAEPAIAPFIKTADGSISPANYVNPEDMEPSYYADETYIPTDPETKPMPEEDVYGKKRRTSRMISALLNDMIQADCKSLKNSKDALKEAIARKKEAMRNKIFNQNNQIKKYDQMGNEIREQRIKELVTQAKRTIEVFIADNNLDNYLSNLNNLINTLEQLEQFKSPRAKLELNMLIRAVDLTMQTAWEIKNGQSVLNSIEQNGIQVSISSGLQAPGTFKMTKTIFQ